MKFRNSANILLAIISIALFTGCLDPASKSARSYKNAQKKLAQGDTASANVLLKASCDLNRSNSQSFELYSEVLLKQNSALWKSSKKVNEEELTSLLDIINIFQKESIQANKREIAKLLVDTKKDSLTDDSAFETIFTYYSYTNSEDSRSWGVAASLYELLREPALLGVESSEELQLFADMVNRQLQGELTVRPGPDVTIQEQMVNMVLTKFKSQIWESFKTTENFDEVKVGLSNYEKELKEFDSKARDMGTSVSLMGGSSSRNKEYLHAVIKSEFESFLTAYSDSLPQFKEALEKAEDKEDLFEIYSQL